MPSRVLTPAERKAFGVNLKRLLRLGNLSVETLAEEILVPTKTLNDVLDGHTLRGRRSDFFGKLGRVATALVEEFAGIKPFGTDHTRVRYTDILTLDPSLNDHTFLSIGKAIEISERLIRQLAKTPDLMHQMSPRLFEKLIAELLIDQGCEVELTPPQKDGGRDIVAFFSSVFGRLSMIVQCKRYKRSRPVSVHILREFLFTVREHDRVNLGLIATSSYVTRDALQLCSHYNQIIKTRDFDGLTEWLRRYGTFNQNKNSMLWTPK